jgi:hypothetical protein
VGIKAMIQKIVFTSFFTPSTTGYFVLPKFSALSQFTLGTVPKAHEEQNGLPGASKPYFSVRSLSGILYTNLFPHGLDIFNLKYASNHAMTLRVAAYIRFEEKLSLPVAAISHENAEI